MKKTWLAVSLALVFTGTSTILHAEADSNAGKQKAQACAGCHGEDGNSPAAMFPKLAGQNSSYLQKQLRAYKDGSRQDPVMSPIAQGLADDDAEQIAAYFAAQTISSNLPPVLSEEDTKGKTLTAEQKNSAMEERMELGGELYRNGDLTRAVSACIACHGPEAHGNKPAAFPVLRSQHADYLIKTMDDFKSGERSTNPDNMMRMITKKMTHAEIRAVAYYISMMK